MIFRMVTIALSFLSLIIFSSVQTFAQNSKIHPENIRLVNMGYMSTPKYYPEIQRIPAGYAKKLWQEGKARFVYVSYSKQNLIIGGIYIDTESPSVSELKLFNNEQPIVIYCN